MVCTNSILKGYSLSHDHVALDIFGSVCLSICLLAHYSKSSEWVAMKFYEGVWGG